MYSKQLMQSISKTKYIQAGLVNAELKYDQCVSDTYPIHSGSSMVSSILQIQYGASGTKIFRKYGAKSLDEDLLCLPGSYSHFGLAGGPVG